MCSSLIMGFAQDGLMVSAASFHPEPIPMSGIHRVATPVSLYPGLVRGQRRSWRGHWLDLRNSASPEFNGRAVAALAADPEVMRYTGTVLVAASVAAEYGFTEFDGKAARPLTLADF
jgi:hypothetical protein